MQNVTEHYPQNKVVLLSIKYHPIITQLIFKFKVTQKTIGLKLEKIKKDIYKWWVLETALAAKYKAETHRQNFKFGKAKLEERKAKKLIQTWKGLN
jgi:hypothetical protein